MMTIRNLFRAGLLGAITTVLAACGSGDLDGGAAATAAKSAATQNYAGVASAPGAAATGATGGAFDAPANQSFSKSQPIPGRYIVVFRKSVGNPVAEAANVMRGIRGEVHHVYSHAIKGFAATIPEAALPGIRRNPNVDYIEQDQTVSLNATDQTGATWGLSRIDQRDPPPGTVYSYNYTGAHVYAFIIDTGINPDHSEFSGRLVEGYNTVNGKYTTVDCNGHGSHVAGTVGGTIYGVAKGAWLVPVRVLSCSGSGTWSGVIKGIDWVAGQSTLRPAVANMSLGGGFSTAVNSAVAGAVAAGVTMVVAAGNETADACFSSPAAEPTAITVGATTHLDARASWSNYGACVDIFAPGVNITSAWKGGADTTNTISGTSMASPHVAGVAVLALAANVNASPAAVTTFLTSNASAGKLSGIGSGSPNLLVYSLASGAPANDSSPPSAGETTVKVDDIQGSSRRNGQGWRAYATVTIVDVAGGPIANATVSGSFSVGGGGSCVTASNGSCTLDSNRIDRSVGSTLFTVTGVAGTGLSWDSVATGQSLSTTIVSPW